MPTLATRSTTNDRGFERTEAVVMEARSGAEDYWFVFDTADGLEVSIAFDTVAFDETDDGTIQQIEFYRKHRRRHTKAGDVEGGRADWGDEIVDALADLTPEATR